MSDKPLSKSARIVAGLVDQIGDPSLHLPEPVREHRFHPTRLWRFDLAWPEQKVAVEVDGGVYVQGRHTRGASYEADCEKINEAAILGWRVLRVTPNHIRQGKALVWIMAAVEQGERRQQTLDSSLLGWGAHLIEDES